MNPSLSNFHVPAHHAFWSSAELISVCSSCTWSWWYWLRITVTKWLSCSIWQEITWSGSEYIKMKNHDFSCVHCFKTCSSASHLAQHMAKHSVNRSTWIMGASFASICCIFSALLILSPLIYLYILQPWFAANESREWRLLYQARNKCSKPCPYID